MKRVPILCTKVGNTHRCCVFRPVHWSKYTTHRIVDVWIRKRALVILLCEIICVEKSHPVCIKSQSSKYAAAASIFPGIVVYYLSDCIDGGILSCGRFMVLGWLFLLMNALQQQTDNINSLSTTNINHIYNDEHKRLLTTNMKHVFHATFHVMYAMPQTPVVL